MQNITFTPPNPEQRRTLLEEYGFKFDRRIREDESPVFPVPAAGRWNSRGASLRAVTLAAIAVLGFFRMCSGGFVIRQQ